MPPCSRSPLLTVLLEDGAPAGARSRDTLVPHTTPVLHPFANQGVPLPYTSISSHKPTRASRSSTRLWAALAAVGAVAFISGCAVTVPKEVKPVTHFDVQRYAGTWYELARIDHSFEKGLSQTSAQYSLNDDGTVKVINKGYNAEKKTWKTSEGKAKFLGEPTVAALKVSFFGPFYGGYNVVDLDADYQTSLVIGGDLDYFWLLSRKKELPPADVDRLLSKAKSLGVDLRKVIRVPQDAQP